MAARKGTRPPNAGKGRKAGVKNRVTQEVREAFRLLVEGNVDRMQGWIDRVAKKHPERALQLLIDVAEFVVPKLSRTEVRGTGDDGRLIVEIRPFGGAESGPSDSRSTHA